MKKILNILTIILIPLTALGQEEYLSRLSISGGVSELGISPSEEIWVATKAGNVYYTKQIGELWHIGPFGSLDPYNFSSGKTFERLNFFSEDTMMISGFIQEGGKQDFVFWSGNHGKTWEKVKLMNEHRYPVKFKSSEESICAAQIYCKVQEKEKVTPNTLPNIGSENFSFTLHAPIGFYIRFRNGNQDSRCFL